MSEEQRKDSIKPILLNLIEDKSWRVRYMVAEKFTEVIVAVFLPVLSSLRVVLSACSH